MSDSEDKGFFVKLLGLLEKFPLALLLLGLATFLFGLVGKISWADFKLELIDPRARDIATCVGLVLMGLGVIAGFREKRAEFNAKEVEGYGVKITGPEKVSAEFQIEGKYKKLPKQPQMAILEKGGTRYWRVSGVEVHEKNKSWNSDPISVTKQKGKERLFFVVIMDKGGQVTCDYQEEVSKIEEIRKRLPDVPVPGWKGWPAGIFECTKGKVLEV
jgi:hypothetical protein